MEYRVVHKDTGRVRYLRDLGVLGKDNNGAVDRVDGFVTDITRQKNAENELKEYRDHLEGLVNERAAEMTRAYLGLKRKDEEHNRAERALQKAESFAILGMHERLHIFGGRLDIRGEKGRGTTVQVSVPLRQACAPEPAVSED